MKVVTLVFIFVCWASADPCSDILEKQNSLRSKHGAPPLTCNDTMSAIAQKYWEDETLKKSFKSRNNLKNFETLTISQDDDEIIEYGFNMYVGEIAQDGSVSDEALKALENWYSGGKCYDFSSETGTDCLPSCFENEDFYCFNAQFTQLVWKGSSQFGLGLTIDEIDGDKFIYVLGLYDPPGNICEQFKDNVSPPL